MADAKARVSLRDGIQLEFEGTEAFVNAQLEKFRWIIHGEPPEAAATQSSEAGLASLFAVSNGSLAIVKKIPGKNRAQQSLNAAKLYLYGLQTLTKRDTARFSEIGAVCRAHRCYDPSNMATNLKNDVESFVFGGHGKKQTVKLSPNGWKAAQALIDQLRAQGI